MTQHPSCEEIHLSIYSLTLAAKVWGSLNGLPVIALHGWMDNANSFDRVASRLNGIRLVALDFPGHGKSDHRPGRMPYYIWEYGLDVLDVADALGWERFGLLGHSLGGGVATLVAGMVPGRIGRLVLIESIGPITAEGAAMPESLLKARQAMQVAAFSQQRRAERQQAPRFRHVHEAVERRLIGPLKLSRTASEKLIERGLRVVPGGFDWIHDPKLTLPTAVRMTEEQVQTHIKQIEAPTDLILGYDGLFMDEKRAAFMIERLPLFKNLTEHRLSGGHHLHMDEGAVPIAQLVTNAFGNEN